MLSIIIPVYNEAASLQQLYEELHWACAYAQQGVVGGRESVVGIELIFVDDGSTDGSWSALADLAVRDSRVIAVRLRRNCGKATAYAAGLVHAHGAIIATMDADLQDDPKELSRMLDALEGHDCIVGWKQHRHDTRLKIITSHWYNALLRRVAGTTLHDHNSGFRVMRRAVAEALPLRGDLHRVIPAIAAMQGFRVAEVPVRHRPRPYGVSKYGRTGLRRWFHGFADLATVAFLMRYRSRPLHFFGGWGAALLALGIAINAYLTILWLGGAHIGRRPLLLLGILYVVVGVQLIATGFLADLLISRSPREEPPVAEVRGRTHG